METDFSFGTTHGNDAAKALPKPSATNPQSNAPIAQPHASPSQNESVPCLFKPHVPIKHLIFDLDNTLYPSSAAIDKGITNRMMRFVADFLGVSDECAMEKRLTGLKTYGTTLEWLRLECGLTDAHIERYFAFVHPESEVHEVPFDADLRPLLESLPYTKTVLTNAPREHAARILAHLGVADLFTAVVDLRANGLCGKPHESAYRRALGEFSVAESLFIDDLVKYTAGYEKIGGTAVLVDANNTHPECKNRIRSVYDLPRFLGL